MRSGRAEVKVRCHLCGATLRQDHEFVMLLRPGLDDHIVICADEARCDERMMFDPVQGENLDGLEARAERARNAHAVRDEARP